MRTLTFRALALLTLLVGGAGGCGPGSPESRGPDHVRANLQPDSAVTALSPDSMHFDVAVAPRVRGGEPVPITLRVRNVGTTPLELYLRGRTIAFDIVVARENGEVVWQRLYGQTIPAILQIRVLAPDELLELADTWDQRTSAGELVGRGLYTVQGVLPTDAPHPLTTSPVPLRVL